MVNYASIKITNYLFAPDHQYQSPKYYPNTRKSLLYQNHNSGKFESPTQLNSHNNYIPKALSTFINSNPNIKYYPRLINNDAFQNNAVPLIINNKFDNDICIPKDIRIATSKIINKDSYNINGTTLTATDNHFEADAQTDHTVNMHIKDHNSG